MDAEQAAWMAIFSRMAAALERLADEWAPPDGELPIAANAYPPCREGVGPCSYNPARHPRPNGMLLCSSCCHDGRCVNMCVQSETQETGA